jgi:HD-like signal output (HDOD) protein
MEIELRGKSHKLGFVPGSFLSWGNMPGLLIPAPCSIYGIAMTTTTTLDELLHTEVLPALPHSAIAMMQLSQNPESGPAEFAKPIEADPGLMGQVLKFVNSSYFGFRSEILSVQQALTLVGTRAITNFALWNAVFSVIPNPKFGPFDLKSLWQDSLRRALFARRLGKQLGLKNAEDLFAAALLQDMAIPLLLKELPAEYESLLRRRNSEGRRLSILEREMFGWDHAEAAALLTERWKLPADFVALIAQHTCRIDWGSTPSNQLGVACVALSSLLPSSCDSAWNERAEFLDGYTSLTESSTEQLRQLLGEVDRAANDFAPLLRLTAPARTLLGYL